MAAVPGSCIARPDWTIWGLTARNRTELLGWEQRLRELDVEFTPVQDSDLGHHLNFRDPDGIALEFYAPNDRLSAAWMTCAAARSARCGYTAIGSPDRRWGCPWGRHWWFDGAGV